MLALVAVLAVPACHGSSGESTRLVGAHRIALAVPAEWKTQVERGAYCLPTKPKTVQFFAVPTHRAVGSCVVPDGASWPAQDSVSVYTGADETVGTPHSAPAGRLHGMPYYIADSRQTGPGVAMTLTVPGAGVRFTVGAATRGEATALLDTIRLVPAGTTLR